MLLQKSLINFAVDVEVDRFDAKYMLYTKFRRNRLSCRLRHFGKEN
jgi:hypothetical protein